jgi:major membrane immunogen (membrane-anchored lipoprotein)
MQNKKKRNKIIVVSLIIAIILLAIITIIILNTSARKDSNCDSNSLIGLFIYETSKTKYSFNEDGTGSMSSDSYNYEYKYEISENDLIINFNDEKVQDVTYSFELKDGILKLTSKKGTVSIGEEYILKKENK